MKWKIAALEKRLPTLIEERGRIEKDLRFLEKKIEKVVNELEYWEEKQVADAELAELTKERTNG